MSSATLSIRQSDPVNGLYRITLRLKQPDQPEMEAEANIAFALTDQEQEDLRWYLEDYLIYPESSEDVQVAQIEQMMRTRGEELYQKVLADNLDTQQIWFAIRPQLANLRIEISTGIAEAASIPWELMRDPNSDSALAVRVQAFVRVHSRPNIPFVPVPPSRDGRIRLLYVVCRPNGVNDVALRAIANRLLQGLGEDRARFAITALRPPTYEQLQKTLTDAKEAGQPFHIVHFDGHGGYFAQMIGINNTDKQGYLSFEQAGSATNTRYVSGEEIGQLLHDTGVPVLVLNACQSAMHEAIAKPDTAKNVHDEVRAIGSLAQAVVDQGIPAVLGMRYSVFVVTAAQYIGELYSALAKGRGFGQAASEARKHLQRNPERWVSLHGRPLQDWFVPVIYEAARLNPLSPTPLPQGERGFSLPSKEMGFGLPSPSRGGGVGGEGDRLASIAAAPELDPVQIDPTLLRYVPDSGFIGRDETLLMLDRAFDNHAIVLLHAYAGQGKTATAVEFARWYAQTGGLTPLSPSHGGEGFSPMVLFTSFELHTDLTDALNHLGRMFNPLLQANGIEWHSLNDNSQRRSLVLQLLRQIPLLWIWDNVEPVAGFPAGTESAWTKAEQTELAEFLKQVKLDQATKAKILLTSRRDEQAWLGGIPQRIAMPRMSQPDAAALALELGKERGWTRDDTAEWQPLLNYCNGNPLTLRVIAGQAVRQGLRDRNRLEHFIQSIRDGEQAIADADEAEGRDKSLGASLDYGFKQAFQPAELPVIALLHLFQGVVDVRVLENMGKGKYALPELGRHTGMDCRYPEHREVNQDRPPWPLGSGNPPAIPDRGRLCRNDEENPNSTAMQQQTPFAKGGQGGFPFDQARLTHLLQRATEIGLLTHLGGTWYSIHPALPWFLRQVYARHYDGNNGRSTAEAALRAWVEAMGALGDYYHDQFIEGNREVIQILALEEANLLHGRRLARSHGWLGLVISAMQGLDELYGYQGRGAEWARLVDEIVPDYCTTDDEPISGREDRYSLVMGYRVALAQNQDRDLNHAAALQDKRVAWNRVQAADALALPEAAALDAEQHNRMRTLGVSVFALGHILMEQNNGDCVKAFLESLSIDQRLADTAGEAITHYNLGHAYLTIPAIRALDKAEAAYQRSLDLRLAHDAQGRSRCIKQIGMVHQERFLEALTRDEPDDIVLKHVHAAEAHYLEAMQLCPANAITDLGPLHNQLGKLYMNIGQTEQAREHYEQRIQLAEQTGDRYHAGRTRYNMALMYGQSAFAQDNPNRRRDLLYRAKAYAEAALRDYRSYQGRAAADEAKAQQLIAAIDQDLAGA